MSFELDNYTRPHILINLSCNQELIISYLQDCNFEVIDLGTKSIYQAINEKAYDFCIFGTEQEGEEPGFNFVKAVRKNAVKVPIIYVAARYDFKELATAYSLGVDDYMTLPINYDELAYRIRAIIRRSGIKLLTGESSYTVGRFKFDVASNTLTDTHDELADIVLASKVAQVLALLCMYNGEVVPKETLISRLWSDSNYYTQRSLAVYMSTLRKALKPDKSIVIETHIGLGFSLTIKEQKQ